MSFKYETTSEPKVGIVMGSESDREIMNHCAQTLDSLEIPFEINVISAHRNPDATAKYAETAKSRGLRVLIGGAGMAAALPGVLAAKTELPVIGVPLNAGSLGGLDALLSIVQMPGGVPVACMAIGKAGAKNAAHFANRMLR